MIFRRHRQQTALDDAIGKANKLMAQEMDGLSLDIQRAMFEKANQKLDKPNLPPIVLGQHPAGRVEGSDGYACTILFDCPNTGKDHAVTCDGRGHAITGSGQYGNTTFDIIQGNWSPAGFCYWVEKPVDGKELVFVMINWAETQEGTVTVIKKKGGKNRSMRTMKLFLEKNETAALCPSVKTVIRKKNGN